MGPRDSFSLFQTQSKRDPRNVSDYFKNNGFPRFFHLASKTINRKIPQILSNYLKDPTARAGADLELTLNEREISELQKIFQNHSSVFK